MRPTGTNIHFNRPAITEPAKTFTNPMQIGRQIPPPEAAGWGALGARDRVLSNGREHYF